jgi:hypothetical protein
MYYTIFHSHLKIVVEMPGRSHYKPLSKEFLSRHRFSRNAQLLIGITCGSSILSLTHIVQEVWKVEGEIFLSNKKSKLSQSLFSRNSGFLDNVLQIPSILTFIKVYLMS